MAERCYCGHERRIHQSPGKTMSIVNCDTPGCSCFEYREDPAALTDSDRLTKIERRIENVERGMKMTYDKLLQIDQALLSLKSQLK